MACLSITALPGFSIQPDYVWYKILIHLLELKLLMNALIIFMKYRVKDGLNYIEKMLRCRNIVNQNI